MSSVGIHECTHDEYISNDTVCSAFNKHSHQLRRHCQSLHQNIRAQKVQETVIYSDGCHIYRFYDRVRVLF